ncbi:MAG: hypothetical protein A3G25_18645 [Betaproteobacteria bacterium RIFCSPLOWO2_12_FULL_63_13]|nr:MAG: hypothetical protein A3G25_18645 [Betaproteobacteria bacterium RIFCSPLOWO2_12_FULL_63_13]
MSTRIRIKWKRGELNATIEDTPTGRAVIEALPLESRACTWGEEVYFEAPVRAKLDPGARQIVDPGTVCFWTEGNAIALPFGRTPISEDARPKLASRCNLLGRIEGDFRLLGTIRAGDIITLTRE